MHIYRSYKNFDVDIFRNDILIHLDEAPNPISYKCFHDCVVKTLDKYAPLKKRYARANEVPYMTKRLRKAISNRSRLQN